MKTQLIYGMFISLFFLTSCTSTKTSLETISVITKKVETKNFTVQVNYANPVRMRPVNLTSEYDLKLKNDSVFAFLPYYGVVSVAPYNSNDGGIKFAESMTEYSITKNKKSNGWNIRFKVKTKEYIYDILMSVFNNGSTSFTVRSPERDMITFQGEVKE